MFNRYAKLSGIAVITGSACFLIKELLLNNKNKSSATTRSTNQFSSITGSKAEPELLLHNMWQSSRPQQYDDSYNGYITKLKAWVPGLK